RLAEMYRYRARVLPPAVIERAAIDRDRNHGQTQKLIQARKTRLQGGPGPMLYPGPFGEDRERTARPDECARFAQHGAKCLRTLVAAHFDRPVGFGRSPP